MKDELPDLTPYLSKKGGNSQGKGADNPAGKTDISSKLSALVKKTGTGTFTVPGADAVSDDSQSLESPGISNSLQESSPSGQSGSSPSSSSSFSSSSSASSTSWADVAAAASSGSQNSQPSNGADKGTASQWDLTALNAKQPWGGEPAPASSSWQQVDSFPSTPEAPPAVSNTFADENPSGTFSASGTFSTKPMRPGGGPQAPSLDMFKAPQAKPMNTLSSGSAPPLLKTPPKDPGRAPAPYTYNANEAPREAVVPKSMQLPSSAQSSSNLAQPKKPTGEQKAPVRPESAEVKRADPPPSWPAQPTSPPRIIEKPQDKAVAKSDVKPEPKPEIKPEAKAQKPSRPETPAELLARAFAEEARALEESGAMEAPYQADDLLDSLNDQAPEQPAAPLYDTPPANLFDDEPPKRSLGFGNLLSGNMTPVEAEEHSTLADLMIPTGEHQALFAPDRQADISQSGLSSFDEVSEDAPPVRLDNQSAPAFSSLFSTEIVTSGQNYGDSGQTPAAEAVQSDLSYGSVDERTDGGSFDEIRYSGEPTNFEEMPVETSFESNQSYEEPREESKLVSKSDVISKLLEAVNQPQPDSAPLETAPTAYSSEFADDDMRTADTMFGSGGSNKGSAEELSAADAVFGAVPDMVAPSFETENYADYRSVDDEPAQTGSADSSSKPEADKSDFPVYDPLALPKGELPMAFGDATNFESVRLEDIKIGKRAAKLKAAEEKAKAEAAAKAKADAEVDANAVDESKSAAASEEKKDPAKSQTKLSLTEMIEQANAAKLEQVQGQGADKSANKPASPKSSLSSLLSGGDSDDSSESLNSALSAPVASASDDDEEDDGLGGAVSDAFDRLLAEGEAERKMGITGGASTEASNVKIQQDEDAAFFGVGKVEEPSSGMSGGLGKLLSAGQSQQQMEPAASVAAGDAATAGSASSSAAEQKFSQPDDAFTQTQANKADALSRLLEVASKGPHKANEEKRNPNDSASKLAAEINRPPGKISRTVDALNPADPLGQGGQAHEQMSAPFGGSSPFTSPFGSPSASQTRQASQSPSPMANPYAPPSDMPQATISNDAVGARIAALNRKLEEGNRAPSASAMNLDAMQQPPATQTHSQQIGVGTGSSPSVNSLSQLPSQVDDSPSTRAELVNRILGSAKISQHGAQLPDLPQRSAPEPVTPDQVSQIRAAKGGKTQQQMPAKRTGRARASRMPGFDPRPLIAIVILLVVVGGGGFWAYQNGIIKLNLPKPGVEAKLTVDQMIKAGDLDRARETLEAKVKSGKITVNESEKLYSIYYNLADKVHNEDPAEAIKMLEKIPSKSKKHKEAQKLIRKLKKKVKKN